MFLIRRVPLALLPFPPCLQAGKQSQTVQRAAIRYDREWRMKEEGRGREEGQVGDKGRAELWKEGVGRGGGVVGHGP